MSARAGARVHCDPDRRMLEPGAQSIDVCTADALCGAELRSRAAINHLHRVVRLPGVVSDRAAWGPPGQLLIVTYGSGSCPRLPNVVTGTGPHMVTVTTVTYLSSTRPSCTADLSPTTSVVREPANLDETRPVTISVDGTRVGLAAR